MLLWQIEMTLRDPRSLIARYYDDIEHAIAYTQHNLMHKHSMYISKVIKNDLDNSIIFYVETPDDVRIVNATMFKGISIYLHRHGPKELKQARGRRRSVEYAILGYEKI